MESKNQYLVYSMQVSFDNPVAMILPIPTARTDEEGLQFINLDKYPNFFEELASGFPIKESLGMTRRVRRGSPTLIVHEVGDFIASYAPIIDDLNRLDTRFNLPVEGYNMLDQNYGTWGFAVFQLKSHKDEPAPIGGTFLRRRSEKINPRTIHPMALRFETRFNDRIYFPTTHFHGKVAHDKESFDHMLYFQGRGLDEFGDETTKLNAGLFVGISKAQGIVAADERMTRCSLNGQLPNLDQYIRL